MMPCLSDHIVFLFNYAPLFGAYTGCGGPAIEHDYVEAIMVAVNSTIECPYCDGLHTELADLAGVGTQKELLAAKDAASALRAVNKPGVAYARAFGEADARAARASFFSRRETRLERRVRLPWKFCV